MEEKDKQKYHKRFKDSITRVYTDEPDLTYGPHLDENGKPIQKVTPRAIPNRPWFSDGGSGGGKKPLDYLNTNK